MEYELTWDDLTKCRKDFEGDFTIATDLDYRDLCNLLFGDTQKSEEEPGVEKKEIDEKWLRSEERKEIMKHWIDMIYGDTQKPEDEREDEKEENDPVNHPKHYQSKIGLEVIDVIEAFTDGLEGIEATDTGNIIKYACRWKEKGGIQDLKKIVWYANHLINYLETRKENK